MLSCRYGYERQFEFREDATGHGCVHQEARRLHPAAGNKARHNYAGAGECSSAPIPGPERRKVVVSASSPRDVFVNCPFDDQFAPGFRALVFAVFACGFRVRCAREMDDGSETRIDKLCRIIEQSRFGIHDLSRTELDRVSGLPRFNMPLELGIFLGAKRFGDDAQRKKRALILDAEPYRYQAFISDLAGIDPWAHGGEPRQMVRRTRDWLLVVSKRTAIPSPAPLLASYERFNEALLTIADSAGLDPLDVGYFDFECLVVAWLEQERADGLL